MRSGQSESLARKEVTMGLENLVEWTRSKISQFTGGDVPVTNTDALDALTSGRVAAPSLDLFENQSEFRLVVDVPGATPSNTHVAWDDFDTLSVRVQRVASAPGAPSLSEYEESDWYREIVLSPEVDGAKAHSTVRHGVLTVCVPKRRTLGSKLIPVHAA
jgi:HSP20 family molecular chaperone IbpA